MLTDKDIEHIAKLARIKISTDEIPQIREKLSSIFEYIGQLNTANTDNVDPMFQTTGLLSAVREDYTDGIQHSYLIEQAPDTKDNFIKVGSVLGRSKK
jgi:aspartyl-tRNA(Asn)/glutamyl-tRNA(Gln) amidotransferase subunit C